MRLQLSKLALADFDDIYDRTVARWGRRQALSYVNALWDALEEIQESPKRGRPRDDVHPGCRGLICGKHLILYRCRDGAIQVSRILHGAMNLEDHVPPDFMGEE